MIRPTLILLLPLLASTAAASQEESHPWHRATITVATPSHGDVEVTVSGKVHVAALTVKAKGSTTTVPEAWLRKLPVGLRISTLEVRTSGTWIVLGFRTHRDGEELPDRRVKRFDEHGLIGIANGKVVQLEIRTRHMHGTSSESLPGP